MRPPIVQHHPAISVRDTVTLTVHVWTQPSKSPDQVARCSVASGHPEHLHALGLAATPPEAVAEAMGKLAALMIGRAESRWPSS